jgi:hypothetical protein
MSFAIFFWTFVVLSVLVSVIALWTGHKRAKVAREALKRHVAMINKSEGELLRQLLIDKLANTPANEEAVIVSDEVLPIDKSGR